MNIFGIGTDIVNVKRIQRAIKKNKNLKNRIFSKLEIKICEKRVQKFHCFAKRFAAKEALFKAIGIHNKLHFSDVEVKNNISGLPFFIIKGKSLKNLKKIFNKRKFKIHLSLSDDEPWAVASVIIFTYK